MKIGVDIGGSKILVVAAKDPKEILRSQKIETPSTGTQALAEITHIIEKVGSGEKIEGIGVGVAGVTDRKKGRFLHNSNMGWESFDLVGGLKNHFKVPVRMENDADTAGLAEAVIGSGQGKPYVLYVTISTGIGIGMIINGEIYHGEFDPEGGHMMIHAENKMQKFQDASSGKALKRRYGLYGYQIKDPEVWDDYSKDLAVGIYNFIQVLSPTIVVIGGGVGVHFHKFYPFLEKHLAELKPSYGVPPVVQATFIETAVAHGALILAENAKK